MGTVLYLPLLPSVSRLCILISNSSCGAQGPEVCAGGSALPCPRGRVCILRPGLGLSGMTGSVTDMFIHTATRRGGRTGHFCLLVAVSSPGLRLLARTNASGRQTGLTLSLRKKIVWGNRAGARRLK